MRSRSVKWLIKSLKVRHGWNFAVAGRVWLMPRGSEVSGWSSREGEQGLGEPFFGEDFPTTLWFCYCSVCACRALSRLPSKSAAWRLSCCAF